MNSNNNNKAITTTTTITTWTSQPPSTLAAAAAVVVRTTTTTTTTSSTTTAITKRQQRSLHLATNGIKKVHIPADLVSQNGDDKGILSTNNSKCTQTNGFVMYLHHHHLWKDVHVSLNLSAVPICKNENYLESLDVLIEVWLILKGVHLMTRDNLERDNTFCNNLVLF